MEIFQTIWTALSTPNEALIQIIGIPFTFIEAYIYMLLFTTVLTIYSNKIQKIQYVFSFSLITIILNLFFPKIYSGFLLMIVCPILIIIIFKTNLLKAIIAEILPLLVSAVLEMILSKIYLIVFGTPYEEAASIPIFRESIVLLIYFCLFIISCICKKYKFNIHLLDNMDKKNKFLLLFNFALAIITISIQFVIITYFNNTFPLSMTVLSIITLLAYFFTSLYSLSRATQLQITEQNLEEAQLYNKSLKILHDNVRAFKHDFSNIVQAIGRLCWY
ncbi:MAG: hypothetical protein HFJ58_02080 [Clostridia bacterium]|nr:hypothetical protein [Clostridia bacterium]